MKKVMLIAAALVLMAGGASAEMHKAKEQPATKDTPMMGQMMCPRRRSLKKRCRPKRRSTGIKAAAGGAFSEEITKRNLLT